MWKLPCRGPILLLYGTGTVPYLVRWGIFFLILKLRAQDWGYFETTLALLYLTSADDQPLPAQCPQASCEECFKKKITQHCNKCSRRRHDTDSSTCRGVPRILQGGMHIFGWPTPLPPRPIWIWIRIRIKILSWIRIRIKTMRIHSPGLNTKDCCLIYYYVKVNKLAFFSCCPLPHLFS